MNCPICENEFIPIISNNNTIYKCPKCNLRHLEPMHQNFDTHFMYINHKYSSDKARWVIDNLDRLIKKACLKVVKKKEYHLGDQYFWPNITNFRQLLANKK